MIKIANVIVFRCLAFKLLTRNKILIGYILLKKKKKMYIIFFYCCILLDLYIVKIIE